VNAKSAKWEVVFFCVLTLAMARAAAAQSQTQWSSLDRFIHSSMKQWKVPGSAVAIVRGQSAVYVKGFGVRDICTGKPVDADTLFDIGSCTKAFTVAAIAMLVDQNKMQWDGKVRDYIPFFHLYDPLADENVTIRDLLTHRTGEPSPDLLFYTPFSREEMIRRLAYVKPNFGFRARFQYNNMMFVTAGYAVGQVTGGTWEQFIRQRIFRPLGMTDSDTSAIEAQKSPDFATPHIEKANGAVVANPWQNIDVEGPAGSINSSARDMAKWIAFQLNDGVFDGKRLISQKSMQAMHAPEIVVPAGEIKTVFFPDAKFLTYGMGWFLEDYRGHELILHPGDIDGFSALVVLIPELHTGYAVLINLGSGGVTYRQVLGYHIADLLLHLPEVDWSGRFRKLKADFAAEARKQEESWESKRNPNTHPSRDLAAYAGTYQNPVYGNVDISLREGQLVFRFYSLTSPLKHFQYDTFVADLEGKRRLTFTLDAEGSVASLSILGARFKRAASAAARTDHEGRGR
jgi:CubicO group peptidase (beta-lactamase class C family)